MTTSCRAKASLRILQAPETWREDLTQVYSTPLGDGNINSYD